MQSFEYIEIKPSIYLMKIDGNLQGGNQAMEFSETLIDLINQKPKALLIDLSGIQIINSSGIGMIVNGFNTFKQNGSDFLLINLHEKVKKLLEITHLDQVFKIFKNLDEALNEYK